MHTYYYYIYIIIIIIIIIYIYIKIYIKIYVNIYIYIIYIYILYIYIYILLWSKISTGRKITKCLQREDGMGVLVRTQHVCTYIHLHTCQASMSVVPASCATCRRSTSPSDHSGIISARRACKFFLKQEKNLDSQSRATTAASWARGELAKKKPLHSQSPCAFCYIKSLEED